MPGLVPPTDNVNTNAACAIVVCVTRAPSSERIAGLMARSLSLSENTSVSRETNISVLNWSTSSLGMAAVGLVLPFQNVVDNWLPGFAFAAILLWVIFEESFKLSAAYVGGINSRDDNEPIE